MKKKFNHFVLFLFLLSLFSKNVFSSIFSLKNMSHECINSNTAIYHIEYSIPLYNYIDIDSLSIFFEEKNILVSDIVDRSNFLKYQLVTPSKKKINILKNQGIFSLIFSTSNFPKENITIEYILSNVKNDEKKHITEHIILPKKDFPFIKKKIEEKEVIIKKSSPPILSLMDRIIIYAKDKNIFFIGLIALFLGVLMSLTPCIYPMIPITISILGIDKKPFTQRLEGGLLYILGISITFSILGLLAVSGKLFFGQLFSKSIFIVGVTILLIIMTLNMLNIINPLFSIDGLQYIPESFKSHRYLPFIYGMFSGTITSPCVSPGLVAVLSLVAQQENFYFGWLLLFMFGIGLSLPLLLIALVFNSGFIFPRSGQWMMTIKEVIGIILCLLIYNNISHFLNYVVAFLVVCLVLGVFLFHKFAHFNDSHENKPYWFCSLSVIVAVIMIAFLGYNSYKKYVDNKNMKITIENLDIIWHDNIEKAAQIARETNTLLLVDVTAEWCSICQIVDTEIFKNLDIMKHLVSLCTLAKVDCTMIDPEKEKIIKRYKVDGFPSILILDPHDDSQLFSFHGEILELAKENKLIEMIFLSKSKINEK